MDEKKKRGRLLFHSAVVALMFGAGLAPAHADDNHGAYPATLCEPWFYQPGTVHYGENGWLLNEDHSGWMTVTCPLITGSNVNSSDNLIRASVRDEHSEFNVQVNFYRQHVRSASRSWTNIGSTTNNSASWIYLSRQGVSMRSANYNHYVVVKLPPAEGGTYSALASIRYDD